MIARAPVGALAAGATLPGVERRLDGAPNARVISATADQEAAWTPSCTAAA